MSVFKTLIKDTAKKAASRSVQKNLRKKELKDKVLSKQPAQPKLANKKVVKEAKRKAKTADRTDKTQAVAKKVLPEVNQVRKKVQGMTTDQLSIKFTGKELKSMEMKLKQASKPNQALLNKLSKARDQRTGMVEAMETPSAYPSKTPSKFRKKGGMVKRKHGSTVGKGGTYPPTKTEYESEFLNSLKPKKNPPKPKPKTKTKKKMGGGKVYKKGHGGKVIKANMSGDDLVKSCYDKTS
jgi:hypothetical protein